MKRNSEQSIDERLRAALQASPAELREGVDMSAAAVTDRVMELCEMSSLALELGRLGELSR